MKKIKEVCDVLNGYAFKSENYVDSGIRVVRIANVQNGYISDEKPCFYPVNHEEEIKKYMLAENDLLISLTGNVGRVALLTKEFLPAALNQRVACLRITDSSVDKKYLFYYLNQRSFTKNCIKASKGVAQLNLSTKWLENYQLYIPSLEEQRQIVSHIEELFSELDNAVKTLKKTKEQLEVYHQAVLKEAFNQISTYTPLRDIADMRLGKMLNKEKNTGIPQKYLRNINVRWFKFNLDDLLEMRIEDNEVDKYSIVKGDLVICEGGEPGRCAVWDYEKSIFYQKALHRVRFKSNYNPKFYMYYMWFLAQTGKLVEYFTGSGIKHLTGQMLEKIVVPNANLVQQDTIVENIESRLSVCDSIEKTVDTALAQAKAMRQSILKQAFEGRLL